MDILMISKRGCIRVLKETIALRHDGHNVHIICGTIPQGRSYYNSLTLFSSKSELQRAIKSIKHDVIHVHNEPDVLVTIAKEVSNGKPVIYDVHDIDSLRGEVDVTQEEKFAYRDADAIIHVSEPCKQYADKLHDCSKPCIVLYSYMNREMIFDDVCLPKEPCWDSVVYEGGLDEKNAPIEGEHGIKVGGRYMYDIFKSFMLSNYSISIYPAQETHSMLYESLGIYVSKPVVYPVMLAGLRPHGFGIIGSAFSWPLMQMAMPNKLFEYMSQGVIPVCINADEAGKFLIDNNLGVKLDSLDNIREVLDNSKDIRKNVLSARYAYTMEDQIHKLVDIYKMLI